ncbi:MAG: TlpA family protein disulfide reductase [Deltaproteobacteria bacterium]|nr:TlpA family protein disulfide reductase [Deltaproteobacteria bacterium]
MKKILSVLLLISVLSGCKNNKPFKAPDFNIPAADGTNCSLKAEKGKVILVELWAVTCPYCLKQAKELEELAGKIDPSKISILSVHARGGKDVADRVNKKISHKNIKVCLDEKTLWKKMKDLPERFQPRGIPHMMIIDKDGMIRQVYRGLTKAAVLEKNLKSFL